MDGPKDLVSVYKAASQEEAHLVKNLLMEEEIDAYVSGGAEPMAGLAFTHTDVLVRLEDEGRALAIVDEFEDAQIERAERPDWICGKCGVTVIGAFDECDSCGAARPGTKEMGDGDDDALDEN